MGSLWLVAAVALVVFLSLTSIPITVPEIEFGDKAGHFFAYFVLMSWFGQLYIRARLTGFFQLSHLL